MGRILHRTLPTDHVPRGEPLSEDRDPHTRPLARSLILTLPYMQGGHGSGRVRFAAGRLRVRSGQVLCVAVMLGQLLNAGSDRLCVRVITA
eukprot:11043135-Heterocapsa_arctica.AAC.1